MRIRPVSEILSCNSLYSSHISHIKPLHLTTFKTEEARQRSREYGRLRRRKLGIPLKGLPVEERDRRAKLRYEKSVVRARERGRRLRNKLNEEARLKRLADPERYREYNRKYYKSKGKLVLRAYRQNPQVRIAVAIRARIRDFLGRKKHKRKSRSVELLGCSVEHLKHHLESLFTKGMSWDNYGVKGWHIDHIIPCSAFDMTDENQQKICFHYRNLRPMWARQNLVKHACITEPQVSLRL